MKKIILMGFLLSCKEEDLSNKKYAFLSINTYEGISLEGLEGADEKCSNDALESNLINEEEYNNRKYKAWISTRNQNAKDRIKGYKGDGVGYNYYTLDNNYIGNYNEIINSILYHPINVHSNGIKEENQYSYVWTGTKYDGTLLDKYFTCNDWIEFGDINLGIYGKSDEQNINWTHNQKDENPEDCIKYFRLYCFES